MVDIKIVYTLIFIMLIASSFYFVNLYFNEPEHIKQKRKELANDESFYKYLYMGLVFFILLSFLYVIINVLEEIDTNESNISKNVNVLLSISGAWITGSLYMLIFKHLDPETVYEKTYLKSFLNMSTLTNLVGSFVFIYHLYLGGEKLNTKMNLDTFAIIFFFSACIFYLMIPIYNPNMCEGESKLAVVDECKYTASEQGDMTDAKYEEIKKIEEEECKNGFINGDRGSCPDVPHCTYITDSDIEYFNLWDYIAKTVEKDDQINEKIATKEKLLDVIDKYSEENEIEKYKYNQMRLYVNKYPNFEDGKFIGKLHIEENGSAKDQAVLTDEQIIENQTFELINYIIDDNTSKFDKDTLLYSWKASIIVSLISSLVITIKNRENIVFLI